MKKVIRWPGRFSRVKAGAYSMLYASDDIYAAVWVRKHVYGRWEFFVRLCVCGMDRASGLAGYAHTMAAAKRCAYRDLMFLAERAGVKGSL